MTSPHEFLHPAALEGDARLFQRRRRHGADGLHRRHDRLECATRSSRPTISSGQVSAGAARTSSRCWPRQGRRPEHLVRLTWYVTDKREYLAQPEGARPRLSRDHRAALSGDGTGAGRGAGRGPRQGGDRGDGGRAGTCRHPLTGETPCNRWDHPDIPTASPATTCRRRSSGRTCHCAGFDYPDWLNAAVELTDRMVETGLRRPYRADRQRAAAHLQGTDRLVEPHRPCAGRGLRREARQPRADPVGQQPGDGRLLAGRDQGGGGGGQHHADAAGGRAGADRRQGARSATRCATRG